MNAVCEALAFVMQQVSWGGLGHLVQAPVVHAGIVWGLGQDDEPLGSTQIFQASYGCQGGRGSLQGAEARRCVRAH
eukprot:8258523-Alexandrium_andersonii.AAC.3